MAARLNSHGILLILWSVAVVGAVPTSAAADPFVVDQALSDRPFGGPHLFAVINDCCPFLAQTYTAGLTGTLVGVSVDVFAAVDSSPLQVALRETYLASWTTGNGTTMSAYFPGARHPCLDDPRYEQRVTGHVYLVHDTGSAG